MDCLTPLALLALAHPELEGFDPRLRQPPAGLGIPSESAPPPAGKSIYGKPYTEHLETTNFTINWVEGVGSAAGAAAAGEALELAWQKFVETDGWTPPVSSDKHYVWVLLVDDLSGTGLTTEYYTDEYPQGYPVIYLTASWASDPLFWRSLAEHEFHHTLEYAVREWAGGEASESWYWEASATWASVLVEPDSSANDYISPWYGDRPNVPFDDVQDSHQYGMFVFNGWLDDPTGLGPDTMRAVWSRSTSLPDATWDEVLQDTTGYDADQLIGSFAAAYGAQSYGRGANWSLPARTPLSEAVSGRVGHLGSAYFTATDAADVTAELPDGGSVRLTSPSQPEGSRDAPVHVEAGELLAVTGVSEQMTRFVLHLSEPAEPDTGDTAAADTGGLADTRHGQDGADSSGCACNTPSQTGSFASVLVLPWALRRRRRP